MLLIHVLQLFHIAAIDYITFKVGVIKTLNNRELGVTFLVPEGWLHCCLGQCGRGVIIPSSFCLRSCCTVVTVMRIMMKLFS